MSFSKFFAPLTLTVMFAWTGQPVSAADVTVPIPTVGAAPVMVGEPEPGTCPNCQRGLVGGKCATCGKLFTGSLFHKRKGPYPVNLCPGACFGYFQTQWRKWDEVCPYPYLGNGPNNGAQKGPGTLPAPRPVDQKMPDPKKVGSDHLPTVPTVPNKFAQ